MSTDTALSLGIILLAGLASARLIKKLKIPTITAYLVLGIFIGPSALNLVSPNIITSSGLVSSIVLSFIAFSLGQNFSLKRFRTIGRSVLYISMGEVIGACALVTLALYLFGKDFHIALVFGAIAAATAPATTIMVIREYKAKGEFTNTLLGVVAVDDAWGIILFAICLAIAKSLVSAHGLIANIALSGAFHAMLEILGAIILGGCLGWCLSYFSRHISEPSELLIYTLGFILLNTGICMLLGLSVLMANMVLGAVLVNVNKTSFKFFDALRGIDSPFYLLFFVLAGANLEVGLLGKIGLLGLIYLFTRVAGKIAGATIGARIVHAEDRIQKYIGLGLIPQAGVALGLALIAKSTFGDAGSVIFSTIVATTIVYELIGPLFTKLALKKAGEI